MDDDTLIEMARRFRISTEEYDKAMWIVANIADGKYPKDLPELMITYIDTHECNQNMKLAIAFNTGLLIGDTVR